MIALRQKVPVVAVFIRRRPEGGHLLSFTPVDTAVGDRGTGRIEALTARFTTEIEAAIRRAPAEWVWWHERWRRRPERTAAPSAEPPLTRRAR
jgi:KDO2-lipid IV(A) lauroyltransferase